MFAFFSNTVQLPSLSTLTELPSTFLKLLPSYSSALAPVDTMTDNKPTATTFWELYLKVKKFKLDYPDLDYNFLHSDNLNRLHNQADQYQAIDDFLTPEQLDIISEYNVIQKQYGNSVPNEEDAPAKKPVEANELKRLFLIVKKTQDLMNYRELIQSLSQKNPHENIFAKLRLLPHNHHLEQQANITALEQQWLQHKCLAFVSSPLLLNIKERLEHFAHYLNMMESEFLGNNRYTQMVYEYWRGVNDEKKIYIATLIEQGQQIISRERYQLVQAMLARLACTSKKDLIAAASGVENNDPIKDDVALAMLLALQPFGIKTTFIQPFANNPRCTLTYPLILQFMAFIIQHGSDHQKQSLSELFNGKSVAETSSPQVLIIDDTLEQKSIPKHVLGKENWLALIAATASERFKAKNYSDYLELRTIFQTTASKLLDKEADILKVCQAAYTATIQHYIDLKTQQTLFTDHPVLIANFRKMALFRQTKMSSEHDFTTFVLDATFQCIANIQNMAERIYAYAKVIGVTRYIEYDIKNIFIEQATQAVIDHNGEEITALLRTRLTAYLSLHSAYLQHLGCLAPEIEAFVTSCKNQLNQMSDQWQDEEKWQHELINVRDLYCMKHRLRDLLLRDEQRIRASTRNCGLFISTEKTLRKLTALTQAKTNLRNVHAWPALQQYYQQLLQNQDLIQHRRVVRLFTSSKIKQHLRAEVLLLKNHIAP